MRPPSASTLRLRLRWSWALPLCALAFPASEAAASASATTGVTSSLAAATEVSAANTPLPTESAPADTTAGASIREIAGRFYIRLATQGVGFASRVDERVTPVPEGFRYEREHRGSALAFGYDFGPRFSVEADLAYTPLDSEPAGSDVFLSSVSILGIVPVLRSGTFRAAVAAGLGFGFLRQEGPDFLARSYISRSGNFGLQVRNQVFDHVRLVAGADYAIHHVAWELISTDANDEELRDIGGTLWVRRAFAGVEFNF